MSSSNYDLPGGGKASKKTFPSQKNVREVEGHKAEKSNHRALVVGDGCKGSDRSAQVLPHLENR